LAIGEETGTRPPPPVAKPPRAKFNALDNFIALTRRLHQEGQKRSLTQKDLSALDHSIDALEKLVGVNRNPKLNEFYRANVARLRQSLARLANQVKHPDKNPARQTLLVRQILRGMHDRALEVKNVKIGFYFPPIVKKLPIFPVFPIIRPVVIGSFSQSQSLTQVAVGAGASNVASQSQSINISI
jgi:hypothetical protein